MEHDLVSVVVTTYNYGRYLPFALESALAQGHRNIEVLVVDDGSTDDSREVAARYLSDPRLRYIHQDNAGQASAKNRGIRESRGAFVAFLDADDVWLPGKLEKQLGLFADPAVGVTCTGRRLLLPDGSERPYQGAALRRGDVLGDVFLDNFLCFSSTMVRRSCLESYGSFDESIRMGIDYDLWIRMAARCRFDFVDEELVLYRVGHAQMSKNLLERIESAWRIMRKNLADPVVGARLSPGVLRRAEAMTLCSQAVALGMAGRRREAFGLYLRSLARDPFSARTRRAFAKFLLGESGTRAVRRLLAGGAVGDGG